MRTIVLAAIAALFLTAPVVQAADRARSQAQIESARSALTDFRTKTGENKIVDDEVKAAERNLEKAAAAQKAGEKMFGGLTDEAEADVRHETALLELNLKLAASKLEKARIETESAVLGKKIVAVQARVMIFDDFRDEIARLKSELVANEKGVKELSTLKKDKSALEDQVAKLIKDKEQLDMVKAENQRLTSQLDKLQAEHKKLVAVPVALPSPSPVKLESIEPVKKIEAPLSIAAPKVVEEKLPAKEVQDKAEPVIEPSVKIEESAAPLIVPAPEK